MDRAQAGGGKATDLQVQQPGFFKRAVAGLAYTILGVSPETFFGPQQPIQPMAEEAEGRQFDYPTGYNIQITPRSTEGISFATMRALADNYDLLRIIIETRKDQLVRMQWKYQHRNPDKQKKSDPAIGRIQEFLSFPDKINDWQTWYRMILEDLFVIDAPTIYLRRTVGGLSGPSGLYSVDLIDGATITRKINADGRTPMPPSPAYQQILKGIPAIDYTMDQLLYLPRNPRVHKLYGYSPVEQIIMTVNIALRRQLHQLEFYTDGNTPDLIFRVPESWNPDQIKKFQLYWDTLTDTSTRRKGKFIPGGIEPYDTKQKELKDAFDEWLARVVCFCFSISPQPFINQINRATAETAKETAQQEGLEPLLAWTKSLLDRIIRILGYPEYEAVWQLEEKLDPKEKNEDNDRKLKAGVVNIDEVRAESGKDPLPDGLGAEYMIYSASGAVLLKDILNPPEPEPALDATVPGTPLPDAGTKVKAGDGKDIPDNQIEKIERRKKKALNPSTGKENLY